MVGTATDGEGARALDLAVDEVLEGLGREIEGLRHLITELRPAALDDLGLRSPALQALARRAQAIDGLDVQTELDLEVAREHERLDAELESTIYRVVQESADEREPVTHSATRAVVSVTRSRRWLDGAAWSVADDGRGLPPTPGRGHSVPAGDGLEGGFGMSGMRERGRSCVGGELEAQSGAGRVRGGWRGHHGAPHGPAGGTPGARCSEQPPQWLSSLSRRGVPPGDQRNR